MVNKLRVVFMIVTIMVVTFFIVFLQLNHLVNFKEQCRLVIILAAVCATGVTSILLSLGEAERRWKQ